MGWLISLGREGLTANLQCLHTNKSQENSDICLSCYTIWREEEVQSQGCWSHAMGCSQDKGCFHNPQLLDYLDGHANSSSAKVCCCVGPMCNANYSDNFHLVKSINSTWSLVLLACLVTFIALLFLISKFWTKSRIRTNSKTSTLNKDVVSTTQEKLLFPMPEET